MIEFGDLDEDENEVVKQPTTDPQEVGGQQSSTQAGSPDRPSLVYLINSDVRLCASIFVSNLYCLLLCRICYNMIWILCVWF